MRWGRRGFGLSLRPTDVLLFGNAKGGKPLVQSIQTIGIDLPVKVLGGRMQRLAHGYRTMIPNWIAPRASRLGPRRSVDGQRYVHCSGH